MESRNSKDPENLTKLRSKFLAHEDHYDISRWHLVLHPSVAKECARNSLPKRLSQFFHPTQATLRADGRTQAWSSRSHRKHRYSWNSSRSSHDPHRHPFWHGIANLRRVEYWNVSWWVAMGFTLGSIIWVVNGFAAFLPFCNTHFMKAPNGTGWTAFIGATVFEIASILGILEAWNRDQTTSFGWKVGEALRINSSHEGRTYDNNQSLRRSESGTSSPDRPEPKPEHRWIWFSADPTYFHELGFLAAFSQLLAASIFWISGFTAIPTIQNELQNNQGLNDGIFWTPQVVGGTGFMISATFIMLEVQEVWWKPRVMSLGWQVGLWNFIGGLGFALSGAFGFGGTKHAAEYQCALSTFWGAWAFLIGSVVQWYECVN